MDGEVKKPSFLVYYDNEVIVVRLSDEEAGKLFKSLFPYGRDAIKPDFDESPALAMAFDILSMAIDRDKERYVKRCEANRENGRKGGRPKKNQTDIEETEKTERLDLKPKKADKDKERDKDRDKDRDSINYQQIADMYNETCVSFPHLTKLSDSRKKAIRARLNQYTLEDFKRLFTMAEESIFLKGQNNRNWSANFDWLIKDANMAKVLDGNYADSRNIGNDIGRGGCKGDISTENHYLKPKKDIETEIFEIVHSRISQEALERYHDKIHELIRLCCPYEIFTQEQIDYMQREWKMEPLHKDSAFVVPREDIYDFYDRKLGITEETEID